MRRLRSMYRRRSKKTDENTEPVVMIRKTKRTSKKKYKCCDCMLTFISAGNLSRHRKILHPEEIADKKSFSESISSQSPKSSQRRTRKRPSADNELRPKLTKPKPFKKRKLTTEAVKTKYEVEIVHSNRFSCSYCPKLLNDLKSKFRHERIHTGDCPFVCKFCKASFAHSITRCLHESECRRLRTEQDRSTAIWCKFCDRFTFEVSDLENHYRQGHGLKFNSQSEVESFRRACLPGLIREPEAETDVSEECDWIENLLSAESTKQKENFASESIRHFERMFQNPVSESSSIHFESAISVEDEKLEDCTESNVQYGGAVDNLPTNGELDARFQADLRPTFENTTSSQEITVGLEVHAENNEQSYQQLSSTYFESNASVEDEKLKDCIESNVQRDRDVDNLRKNGELDATLQENTTSSEKTTVGLEVQAEISEQSHQQSTSVYFENNASVKDEKLKDCTESDVQRDRDVDNLRKNNELDATGQADLRPASFENTSSEETKVGLVVQPENKVQSHQPDTVISQISDMLNELGQDNIPQSLAKNTSSEQTDEIDILTNIEQQYHDCPVSKSTRELLRILQDDFPEQPLEIEERHEEQNLYKNATLGIGNSQSDLVQVPVDKLIKYEIEVAQLDIKLREIFHNNEIVERVASECDVQNPKTYPVIDLTENDEFKSDFIIVIDDD